MENVFLTSLTTPEVRQLFRDELENYFAAQRQNPPLQSETDLLLTLKQAGEFLSLSVRTTYGRVVNKTDNKLIVNSSPKPIDWFKLITQVVVLLKLILEIIHHS
jgi:hypothetical protein